MYLKIALHNTVCQQYYRIYTSKWRCIMLWQQYYRTRLRDDTASLAVSMVSRCTHCSSTRDPYAPIVYARPLLMLCAIRPPRVHATCTPKSFLQSRIANASIWYVRWYSDNTSDSNDLINIILIKYIYKDHFCNTLRYRIINELINNIQSKQNHDRRNERKVIKKLIMINSE